MIIVKIYLGISLELLRAVWDVHCGSSVLDGFLFQLILLKACPFQCSWCEIQGFNLLQLSLPKWFPLFLLASSVCKSLQRLISALTQGGEGGHLFRLTCSVCCREGGTLQANTTGMCGERSQCLGHTGFAPAHRVCFPGLHCSGSSLLCRGTL